LIVPLGLKRRFPGFVGKSGLARCGLAALAVFYGTDGLQTAVANGDTRTISMHHVHSGENITITYKRNGRFDDEALKKLNWFLRDWRRNEATKMDPRLIDIVWEVWREVGAETPVDVIGGYRAPATNNMLRRRSKGVARNSQHTVGHAMDFYIPGASLEQMRHAGLRLQRGGVGYYPSSGSPFVHLDTGSVRHWPRMTYEQLARVFPNGRTVHVPSNGKPLPGYALALADLEKRGNSPSANSLMAARDAGIATDGARKGLLASLFRGGKDDDEEETTATVAPAKAANTVATTKVAAIEVKQQEPARVANVPLPQQRPARPVQVASTAPKPTQVAAAASALRGVTLSASSVIATRGVWDNQNGFRQIGDGDRLQVAALASAAANETPVGYATVAYASFEKSEPKSTLSKLKFTRQANALEIVPKDTLKRTARETKTPTIAQLAPMAQKADDIWLRAVMLAPDLQYYLSATLIGAPDPKELRPLMLKPASALTMSFSNDPATVIPTDRFSGDAVVFLDTVSFSTRTASLR
jgi:uncharacterized protein YcbK (DUF882 family)